jgi:hypothetical protein
MEAGWGRVEQRPGEGRYVVPARELELSRGRTTASLAPRRPPRLPDALGGPATKSVAGPTRLPTAARPAPTGVGW